MKKTPLTTHHSSLTTHNSPLTTYHLLLFLFLFSGCAIFKKGEEKKEETNVIQKEINPLNRRNSEENKPSQAFIEFRECLSLQFNRAIDKRYNNKGVELEQFKSNCQPCYQKYFSQMKGDRAYSPQEFDDAVEFAHKRQQQFIDAINKLKREFESNDIMFEPQTFGRLYKDPFWDTGVESGCNIMTEKGAYLCMIPIMPIVTGYYGAEEEPVAANILSITKDYILFMNSDQFAGSKFQKACEKIFPKPEDNKMMFLGSKKALKYGDEYMLVESSMEQSRSTVFQILMESNIFAFVSGNTYTKNGSVYYQEMHNYPKLLNEFIVR